MASQPPGGKTIEHFTEMTAKQSSKLALYLAEKVRESRRCYPKRLHRCQKKFSVGAVHDLRVETRRVLALLHLLEELDAGCVSKKLVKRFKKRLDVFDGLRDTQVQLRLLSPMWSDFPDAAALKKFLCRHEALLISKLAHKINATKYSRLSRQLKHIEKQLQKDREINRPGMTLSAIGTALNKAFRETTAVRRQVQADNATTIHKLRVAFKRFRYMVELLQPWLPHITARQLNRMKAYQAAAGDIQDLEVLLRCMAQTVRKRKLNPGALRDLRSELLQRKHDAINSFMHRIDELLDFRPSSKPDFLKRSIRK
jgi:CHAD domain-containing protein